MTEREIQESICKVLTLYGIVHSVTDASRSFTPDGGARSKVRKHWPDVTAVLPGGRALFIECKTAKGKATPGQLAMLDRLQKQGAVAVIARSGFEVHALLKELLR